MKKKCAVCGKEFKKILIAQKVCLDCLKKKDAGDIQPSLKKP